MTRPALPRTPANVVTVPLADERHLIAHLDLTLPEQHSPLQRALTGQAQGEPPETDP